MAGTYVFVGPNSNMASLTSIVDGSTPAAGQIGELLSATTAANTTTGVGSNGVYGNVVSLSVTPGRWLIYGTAAFNTNGATTTAGLQCGVSSSATGVGIGEFDTAQDPVVLGATDLIMAAPPISANISATTTYYLNTKFNYSAGSPRHRGKIYALRIG